MSPKEKPQNEGSKRTWTRRTRILIEEVPSDIFTPEVIASFRERGEEKITPFEALNAFGIIVDETQLDVLHSALLQVDNEIFLQSETNAVFYGKNIEQFIKAALGARFQIFEIAAIPLADKEAILKNASSYLSQVALEQRARDSKR